MAKEIFAINHNYPCCGHHVRFVGDEHHETGVPLEKRCRRCGRRWWVVRSVMVETPERRLDNLVWHDTRPEGVDDE
jgi:hypothetical protein